MNLKRKLFNKEIVFSLGCTEVVAIGLATSLAYNSIIGKCPAWLKNKLITPEGNFQPKNLVLKKILVLCDRNVFKNALAVGVPGFSGEKGIDAAAAMGMFCKIQKGQEVLLFSKPVNLNNKKYQEYKNKVEFGLVNSWQESENIEIQLFLEMYDKKTKKIIASVVRLVNTHTGFNSVAVYINKKPPLFKKIKKVQEKSDISFIKFKKYSLDKIIELAKKQDIVSQAIMLDMAKTNYLAAQKALKLLPKNSIAKILLKEKDYQNLIGRTQVLLTAAHEARLIGQDCQIVASAGSGGQGLILTLPILVLAQNEKYNLQQILFSPTLSTKEKKQKQHLLNSLALGNLVTIYITYHTRYLSALCGCGVKSGLGAAGALAYFLTKNSQVVEYSLQNMQAGITGMICDGAKHGCAFKLATAASAACLAAYLAKNKFNLADNGIVSHDFKKSVNNLGRLCKIMNKVDDEIVRIMQNK